MDLLVGKARGGGKDRVEADRTGQHEHEENAEREAKITDAVDHEGLDGGGIGRRLFIPEADQQIGCETDALPPEEHLHQIVGGHQHQHGEGEQRQIGEETRPARIFVHVADRVEMDERGDARHHDQHHRRQRVDAQRPVDLQRPGADPVAEDRNRQRRLAEGELSEHDPRQNRRHEEKGRGDEL